MKEWILSVCGTVILTTVAFSVIPQGKTGKIIKSIFSIMCIAVFIKPIILLNDSEINYEFIVNNGNFFIDENYLNYVSNLKEESLSKSVYDLLHKRGFKVKNVQIDLFYNEEKLSAKSVFIRLDGANIEIETESKHIIDEVYSYLNNKIEINENIIKIDE